MEDFNKGTFVEFISKNHKVPKAEALRALDMVIQSIQEAVSSGKELKLLGFGSFYATKTKEREGKNPKTGEKIMIKASTQPRFKAGALFKKACNLHEAR